MPFKNLIMFAKVKLDMTVMEAFDKMKEHAEKHGVKIQLMGIPTGMTEQVVIVYDVDEGLDKFYSRMIESRKDLSIAEWPLVEGRTHAVFVP